MDGKKAHSWNDAFNRCGLIKNGNSFPIIIKDEADVTIYLRAMYGRLHKEPGKATINWAV